MMPFSRWQRFLSLSILLIGFVCSLGACAPSESQRRDFYEGARGLSLQWPPPPQNPRILYVGTIREPLPPEKNDSWTARLLRGVLGADQTSPVLVRPYGVFADRDRVYVTDPGSGTLHIFDLIQKKYIDVKRAGEDELASPIGVAADGSGNIYVSDSVLRRVFIFDREGQYRRSLGSSELFQRPAGIAVKEERIYIVDTHDHKVFVLALTDGGVLSSFGGQGAEPGTFNYPTNIFVARDGLIYVMDSMNFRVQIFRPDGAFASAFGKPGDGSGSFSKPKGIAVDSEGHIYVADAHFDNIQIFDSAGKLLLIVGNSGNSSGEFSLPSGIFIDSLDRIYVADSLNRRIQIFQYLKEGAKNGAK